MKNINDKEEGEEVLVLLPMNGGSKVLVWSKTEVCPPESRRAWFLVCTKTVKSSKEWLLVLHVQIVVGKL